MASTSGGSQAPIKVTSILALYMNLTQDEVPNARTGVCELRMADTRVLECGHSLVSWITKRGTRRDGSEPRVSADQLP